MHNQKLKNILLGYHPTGYNPTGYHPTTDQLTYQSTKSTILKKNGPTPASFFVYFNSVQTQFFTEKTVVVSGIWTRIFGVEGEHANHLTTTTAPKIIF